MMTTTPPRFTIEHVHCCMCDGKGKRGLFRRKCNVCQGAGKRPIVIYNGLTTGEKDYVRLSAIGGFLLR